MSGFLNRWNKFLDSSMRETFDAFSLLALRLVCGGGLALHGFDKFNEYSALSNSFPDPLHVGSPAISLSLAIFGELFCGALVALGFCTRIFVIPSLFTMCVAVLVIHAGEPYAKKELALLYMVGFFVLLLRGGGPLSVDGLLSKSPTK